MKSTKWILLAGMVLLLLTMGCDKQLGLVAPGDDNANAAVTSLGRRYNNAGSWFLFFYATPTTTPVVHPMSIGQDNGQNGSVTIYRDATNLYVAFHVDAPIFLYETHVDVEMDSAHLRHNKAGNLNPGQFPFGGPNPLNPPAQDRLITIPLVDATWLSGWNGTDPLAWAAMCKVFYVNEDGDTVWNTGCGSESTYKYKQLSLPDYQIYLQRIDQPFAESCAYWQIGLSGIGAGTFNVWNGDQWKGWCVERDSSLYTGVNYFVQLIDSRDLTPSSPPRLWQNGNWPQVNWLLNQIGPHAGLLYPCDPYGDYTEVEYQDVIHAILGQYTLPPLNNDPSVQRRWTMYNAAMTHTTYNVPVGGWVAVLAELCSNQTDPNFFDIAHGHYQTLFLQVDP